MNFTKPDFDFKVKEISHHSKFLNNTNVTDSIDQLENEKLLLRQLIAQLRHENQLLKKRLFNAGKIEISKGKCA